MIKPVGGGGPPGGGGAVKKGEKWPDIEFSDIYISGTLGDGYFQAWLYASSGLGSRKNTWVYLQKNAPDAEWYIKEFHTGDEDDPEINWPVHQEYKRLD